MRSSPAETSPKRTSSLPRLRPVHDPSFPNNVHGPEGIKRYVTAYCVDFPDLRVAAEDQLAEEDKVVTRWKVCGTHSGGFLGLAPTDHEVAR